MPEKSTSVHAQLVLNKARREFLLTSAELAQVGAIFAASAYLSYKGFASVINLGADRNKNIGKKDEPLYSVISTSVNRVNIDIVGVEHITETFFKHQGDIASRIKQAPVVMMEYFNTDIARLAESGIPDEILGQGSGYNPDVNGFFALVARECSRQTQPLDIIVANPETGLNQITEMGYLFGIPGSIAVTDTAEIISRKFCGTDILKIRTSRRNFFKRSGMLLSGIVWASTVSNVSKANSEPSEVEKATQLAWCEIDYRNVRTASGIDSSIKSLIGQGQIKEGQTIPIFQGYAHGPTKDYLQNCELRKIKSILYAPYAMAGEKYVRRYHFSKNKWELAENIQY